MAKTKTWLIFDEEESLPEDHPAAELARAARSDDWNRVDEVWMSIPASRPQPAAGFRDFYAEARKKKGAKEVAGYVNTLLGGAIADEFAADALEIALLATPYVDDPETVREALASAVRRAFAIAAEHVIESLGLNDAGSAAKAARELEKLARLRPGSVCKHQFYDVGVVHDIDHEGKKLTMNFPGTAYSGIPVKFEHVDELLSPLPRNHFDALRLTNPEAVKALAAEDPARLVRRVATARGGRVSQSDLKAVLTANVMKDAEFKNWWGKRRADVVRDPHLDVEGKGANCVFALREDAKPFHYELCQKFQGADSLKDRLETAREVARAAKDEAFPPKAFEYLLPPFKRAAIEFEKMSRADRIGWALVGQLIASVAPQGFEIPGLANIRAELRGSVDPAQTIAALEIPDLILPLLGALKKSHPDNWHEVIQRVAEVSHPRVLERALETLSKEGKDDDAVHLLGRVVSFPMRNPNAYFWAVKGMLEGSLEPHQSHLGLDKRHLVDDLMNLLEDLRRGNPADTKAEEKVKRDLAGNVAKLLSERQHRHIADVVVAMPVAEARAFYEELVKRRLDEEFVSALRLSLRKSRNDLESESSGAAKHPELDGNVILCVEASRDAKLKELNKLKTVDIPANAKAIGTAAEMGDLRENAEYQTAKDLQKVLVARSVELETQLHRARAVSPDSVTTKAVSFGTRFKVKGEKGKAREFTLLGPWESDPDKGIISYLAPLGRSFYKKKVGEKVSVELPGGDADEFVVEEIKNALA